MSLRPLPALAFLGLVLAGSSSSPNELLGEVDLLWGVKIPLRDGVKLNATVFKPKPQPEPLPVVFTLTPYIGDTYDARAMYFARHGYVFALVDVRGRGNSEGRFMPFENEASDGHDVVEWLAQQPWCNGKVAMWGGSYAGYDQWATAKERPPHLATIVPAAAAAAGVDFPFWNNISFPYLVQWRTYTSGLTPNLNLFADQSFWISKFQELFRQGRPFKEFDTLAGNPSDWFQKTITHPRPDDYWMAMRPTPEQYAALDIPILTITGHYDDDQPGALHYYRMHMKLGSAQARERHYLLLGPWDHAGTRTPSRDVGGLHFGEAALVDLNGLHKEWYDWTMKGGPKPSFLEKRVAYYVAGADVWRRVDNLEDIEKERRAFYLHSAGRATDVFRSGALLPDKPGKQPSDAYVYDPLDLRPADLEREEIKEYLTDQRYLLNTFGNGVFYVTEPFAEDTEVTGFVRFRAYISMDVPDTDLRVSLYEVMPDGKSVLLAEDQMRARYRESVEREALVKPGQILRYDFEGFPFFSRRLAKGSRLRLFLRSPNSVFLQKNYNGGGVVAEEGKKDARTAHVSVHHDAAHPSVLEIPVAR